MAFVGKADFIINRKYRLVRKIGSGSFGDIYLGVNINTGQVKTKTNHCFMFYVVLIVTVLQFIGVFNVADITHFHQVLTNLINY